MKRVKAIIEKSRQIKGGKNASGYIYNSYFNVTSIKTAAFITIIGCWLFRNWLEGEMNRMFDEEGIRTDKHIFEMTAAITELTRNTSLNKKGNK